MKKTDQGRKRGLLVAYFNFLSYTTKLNIETDLSNETARCEEGKGKKSSRHLCGLSRGNQLFTLHEGMLSLEAKTQE